MSVELPKDANGCEIPLDTECLYTYKGEKQDVLGFTYCRKEEKWEIETDLRIVNSIYLYITPPDSWEKLEEDLGRAAERDVVPTGCRYFNATNKCAGCPLYGNVNCDVHRDERAFGNIISRIRKLRGDTDA